MHDPQEPVENLDDIASYANAQEKSGLEFMSVKSDGLKNVFLFGEPGIAEVRGELKIQRVADRNEARAIKGHISDNSMLLKGGPVYAVMYRVDKVVEPIPPAPEDAIAITPEQIRGLADAHAKAVYLEAFANATAVLAAYEINLKPLRLAHFMAQVLHETGGLRVLVESMDYRAETLVHNWPKHFANLDVASQYAHNEQKLANYIYGSTTSIGKDLGNTEPGDGWRFIGRGLMQITGRECYGKYGARVGADLTSNPDLAFSPDYTLKIAAEEWNAHDCNSLADADDIKNITLRINGGYNGLPERREWFQKTSAVWH